MEEEEDRKDKVARKGGTPSWMDIPHWQVHQIIGQSRENHQTS